MPASDAPHPHGDAHPMWAQLSRSRTGPVLCQPSRAQAPASHRWGAEESGRVAVYRKASVFFLVLVYNPSKRHGERRGIGYQKGCGPRWHPVITSA